MRRYLLAVLACALGAIAISACGSSTSNKSTPSTSNPPAQASGPAGPTINLGSICSCSGAQAAQLSAESKVIQAWASSVNAAGGINGHAVKVTVMDDGGNPATSLQDAKTLVEQDHVMAIVGETSLADASWASYVASQGVPVVGGISPEAPFLTNPDFYPSGTQLVVQSVGTVALAKAAGETKIAGLYCAESPICAQAAPLIQGAAQLYGLKSTTGKISATAPNYTAPCLAAKNAGVNALFVIDNADVVQRFITDCAQQGYKPQQVSQTSASSNLWLTDPDFQGILLSGTNANPFDASLPATQQFQAALQKYDPGLLNSSSFTYDSILPWAGGELFEAAAKAADIGPKSTGADVKKGLYSLKNETLGGLAPPLNFTPGKPAFISCYFTEAIKGGKFVSLNNNKPTCLTAAQGEALLKSLHL